MDTDQYARENGWAIRSLADLFESTGDESALRQALAAAQWVCDHRAISDGGFMHDGADSSGPYLGDTLSMGQAFLELYEATGDRPWLMRAQRASDFISAHFLRPAAPGVMTADVHVVQQFPPEQGFDENVEAARWATLLGQYTGRDSDKSLAKTAMRYLATPDVALSQRVQVAGVLLANDESATPALHITVVGAKSDAASAALFHLAMTCPTSYKRLEWYDFAEGPLPNPDVAYPHLAKPAAFVCSGTACSRPAFTVGDLGQRLAQREKLRVSG